jgi:hypothetical protein
VFKELLDRKGGALQQQHGDHYACVAGGGGHDGKRGTGSIDGGCSEGDASGREGRSGVLSHLIEFLRQRAGQCGIIYCRLRATCDWLAMVLAGEDMDVGCYHAGVCVLMWIKAPTPGTMPGLC